MPTLPLFRIALLARFALLAALVLPLALFNGCDENEPGDINEGELITKVVATMTAAGQPTVTLTAEDADEDGEYAASEITVTGALRAGVTYTGTLTTLDGLEDGTPVNIREEVIEEASEHLFQYVAGGGLASRVTFAITDQENDYPESGSTRTLNLGLAFTATVTAGAAATGTVTVVLYHFDPAEDVQKTTDNYATLPAGVEEDIRLAFPVSVN